MDINKDISNIEKHPEEVECACCDGNVNDLSECSLLEEIGEEISGEIEDLGKNENGDEEPIMLGEDIEDIKPEKHIMIDRILKKRLMKQSYRIVGTHSAVKLCHWFVESILSGAMCYKHQFYGIKSNRCMQCTTSLCCCNLCSFCWRDRQTPTSDSFDSYVVDEPLNLTYMMLNAQRGLVKQYKEKRSSNKEMVEDGMKNIKHAALSLAGESLLYPYVNEVVKTLHKRGISTFIVTNAQLPEKIDFNHLKEEPTQLYLSIDAGTEKSLKNIDNSMFEDCFQRMQRSLEMLAKRHCRTAVRLTAVYKINMSKEEIEGYSKLIRIGKPDFIEVKSFAYVGSSRDRLGWENVPYPYQLAEFTEQLLELIGEDYEYVTCHRRSKAILLANKKFFVNGHWCTRINFDKFFEERNKSLADPNYIIDKMAFSDPIPDDALVPLELLKRKEEQENLYTENGERLDGIA